MRVLLLYITHGSGHYHASLAIERALRHVAPRTHVTAVDAIRYTNPVLARLVIRTYMGVLKTHPEVWEYLYDNPKLIKQFRTLREIIHKYNSVKFRRLILRTRPDVVVCTQALPCGMLADFKASTGARLPLVAVVTDFAPHSYWVFDEVDAYVVPNEDSRQRLLRHGIGGERITVIGIPIDPHFAAPEAQASGTTHGAHSAHEAPLVLVMGGSTGLGPLRQIILALDRLPQPFRLHVITGKNRSLYRWCLKQRERLRHPFSVDEYVSQIWTLMRRAALLITKPGGLTTAEALAVGLPLVLVNPIPGQEAKNTEFLLRHDVAVRAPTVEAVALLVDGLLRNPGKRAQMRRHAAEQGRPRAAFDVAQLVLTLYRGAPSLAPTLPIALASASR